MNNLVFKNTPLENLKIIDHKINKDERGYLSRLFCQNRLNDFLEGKKIQQINKTLTKKKELFVVCIFSIHHMQKKR